MAQADPSQSTGRDTGTNPAEGFGRFKVDLADHLDVPMIQRLSILLGLKPGEIDSIKRSKTPGLEMVNLLDDRGIITHSGITDLLEMLQELKLAGLSAKIQSSFQAKTSQAKKDPYLEELAKLYRIAFDGLTKENQQLSWEKTYLVSELGQEFYDNYMKLGMLAQEVVFDNSQCRYKTVARISLKILCEFYASHHLVWILSEGASSAASSINVKETLKRINPLDLQYVYRFACGLNKSAADIILKHLQETQEGRQFAILCMLEQEEKSDQFQQSVKDLVSSTIRISLFHAKLLQRSTIQVLEAASAKQIPISCVFLNQCSPRVDESGLNLILQSGLSLSILSSLQKLWIYGDYRRLTNEELAAILSYSSQCTSMKELKFGYPMLAVGYIIPETIPVTSIPSSLKTRNVKVWNILKNGTFRRLNLQTGQWQACDNRGNLPGEKRSYQSSLAKFNQERCK
ncbi:uncharacterized protein [Apostichopus japonicus]|uniref:uncharacterized protein isoform X2 n=1 Tax=Stichopus japonicus TaxID=307972 RepID=UPI003AB64758